MPELWANFLSLGQPSQTWQEAHSRASSRAGTEVPKLSGMTDSLLIFKILIPGPTPTQHDLSTQLSERLFQTTAESGDHMLEQGSADYFAKGQTAIVLALRAV